MGASVDGVLENGDIVEIKTTSKPTPKSHKRDYSEIPLGHMDQMQQNMSVTGARICHYFSFSRTSGKNYYRAVPFMQEKWNLIVRSNTFFYNNYMKKLLQKTSVIEETKSFQTSRLITPTISFAQALKK